MKESLAKQSAFLDDIYYCPHKSEDGWQCKKPQIGLLLKAKENFS